MRRREFLTLLFGGAAAHFGARRRRAKSPHIGVLFSGSPATFALRTKAFRQGLADLGYVEERPSRLSGVRAEERVDDFPSLPLSW